MKMPKQRHKRSYKRGVFKLKNGGPKFRPRGIHKKEAPDMTTLLGNLGITTSKVDKLHQGRR